MPHKHQPKHLMWAMMLLQTHADESDMAKDASGGDGDHVDLKTFRKWGWLFVEAIALLESTVILWENYINDINSDAMVSV